MSFVMNYKLACSVFGLKASKKCQVEKAGVNKCISNVHLTQCLGGGLHCGGCQRFE